MIVCKSGIDLKNERVKLWKYMSLKTNCFKKNSFIILNKMAVRRIRTKGSISGTSLMKKTRKVTDWGKFSGEVEVLKKIDLEYLLVEEISRRGKIEKKFD